METAPPGRNGDNFVRHKPVSPIRLRREHCERYAIFSSVHQAHLRTRLAEYLFLSPSQEVTPLIFSWQGFIADNAR